jgi:membrane dipeptidase
MHLNVTDLDRVFALDPGGRDIVVDGWMCPFAPGTTAAYFALVDEPPCCIGCVPGDASRRIEVFADPPIAVTGEKLRLTGVLHRLDDDSSGWRFQLRGARLAAQVGPRRSVLTRRRLLATGPLVCAAVAATSACADTADPAALQRARDALAHAPTVDIHSHAGGVNGVRRVENHAPFSLVAAPMRDGGMAAICLAAVPDSPTHKVMPDGRIHPFRTPAPGELYAFGQRALERVHDLARAQDLPVITDAAGLAAARGNHPSVIVASEGADFLEGQLDRVAEAYERWQLRHLQLTHYRVNELGDIQTEPPVHGGLTDFGAEVIRACNRQGLVVDVAHGTFDLVKRAAAVTTKPLVLSHTSLSAAPKPGSRLISSDHARVIAGTGGVIGIWPPASIFPDKAAMAAGIARMVDLVGVDHVGLGSDMRGLVGASTFDDYDELPALAAALLARGFTGEELRKLLGGNYVRVFTASLA